MAAAKSKMPTVPDRGFQHARSANIARIAAPVSRTTKFKSEAQT